MKSRLALQIVMSAQALHGQVETIFALVYPKREFGCGPELNHFCEAFSSYLHGGEHGQTLTQ